MFKKNERYKKNREIFYQTLQCNEKPYFLLRCITAECPAILAAAFQPCVNKSPARAITGAHSITLIVRIFVDTWLGSCGEYFSIPNRDIFKWWMSALIGMCDFNTHIIQKYFAGGRCIGHLRIGNLITLHRPLGYRFLFLCGHYGPLVDSICKWHSRFIWNVRRILNAHLSIFHTAQVFPVLWSSR